MTTPALTLPTLQNLIKRDPESHYEDFIRQVRLLESNMKLLKLNANRGLEKEVVALIQFCAAVSSSCFKSPSSKSENKNNKLGLTSSKEGDAAFVALYLVELLFDEFSYDVRSALLSAIILMRNKNTVNPQKLVFLLFEFIQHLEENNSDCEKSKKLADLCERQILQDLKNLNKNTSNVSVNRSVQGLFFSTLTNAAAGNLEDAASIGVCKRILYITSQMYSQQVWNDEFTVSIMAEGVRNKNSSIMTRAIRFFLMIEEQMENSRQMAKNEEMEKCGVNLHLHSKKTKARKRETLKQIKQKKKVMIKQQNEDFTEEEMLVQGRQQNLKQPKKLYPAIELLNDPHGLADLILRRLKTSGVNAYKFEVKLLMINFITRLVGNHELIIIKLYPFLQKYLGGHQKDVTNVLAYTVQACHEMVPPDEIAGILKTIAHNFITERCTAEQMAVGINSVRAICSRVPSVLVMSDEDQRKEVNEDDDEHNATSSHLDVEAFVKDLAGFAKHQDRSVMMAGKSWVNFIREVHPSLLAGKDRGTVGAALKRSGQMPLRYGEQKVSHGVEGADLLVAYEAAKKKRQQQELEEKRSDYDGSEGEEENSHNEEEEEEEEEEVEMDEDEMDEIEVVEEDEEDDEEAPDLVDMDETENTKASEDGGGTPTDLSKLTDAERKKLQMEVSSTRVFSTADFVRMRKLVEREKRAQRDPREQARRKRAIAQGDEFEELSDDDDLDSGSESEDEGIRVKGVLNPEEIMAVSRKKRLSKVERLEKVIAGREKWESKQRAGGSTNEEKTRKKNFVMTKFSFGARQKVGQKQTTFDGKKKKVFKHDAKKRRRK